MDFRDLEYWTRQAIAENLMRDIMLTQSVRMSQAETKTVQSWIDDTMMKINDLRGTYADEAQNAAKWQAAINELKSWQRSRKANGAIVRKPRRSDVI